MGEKWVTNAETGILECIDDEGRVLAKEKLKNERKARRTRREIQNETHHYILDGAGRKRWVPKGTNPDNHPGVIFPFAEVTCDHILRRVMEGMTLTKIATLDGMPPAHIIHKWMRKHPEFREEMEIAKRARAEWRADQVMAIADQETIDENEVAGQRLRKDILQWGAANDNQAEFGKQTKVSTEVSGKIEFTVVTGVPEPKAIEVTSTPLQIESRDEVPNS